MAAITDNIASEGTSADLPPTTTLDAVINSANAGNQVVGTFTADVVETTPPVAINLTGADSLVLNGGYDSDTLGGYTLTSDGTDPALTVTAGAPVIEGLNIDATSDTAPALSIATGATVVLEATTYQSTDVTGVIAGGGSIHVGGGAADAFAEDLTLSSVETYTGSTVVYGDLTLAAGASIAASSNVSLKAAGATFDVSATDDTSSAATGATTGTSINELTGVAGSSVVLGNNTLTVTETVNAGFSGVISDGGDVGGLTLAAGAGTLTLLDANTYTGSTRIYGHLAIGAGGSISDSSNVSLKASGAVLDISGASQASGAATGSTTGANINELTGTTGASVVLGSNTLTVTQTSDAGFAGVISGAGGLTVAAGEGDLILTGANTYTGSTRIYGDLALTDSGSLASSNVSLKATDATLDISNADGTSSAATGSTTGASINELTGVSGSFVDVGANTLTVNETASAVFSGDIYGTGGLTLAAGTLDLAGQNLYTGSTRIFGDLRIGAGNAISNSSNVSLKASGATLDISQAGGNVTIHELTGVAGSSVVLGANTLVVNENGPAASFSGVISGSGGLTINSSGSSALTLTGANTYTGVTTIVAGTLALGANGSIADITTNGTAPAATTGGIDMLGGTLSLGQVETSTGGVETLAVNNLYGSGGTVSLGGNSLSIYTTNASGETLGSSITGSGSVNVYGSDVLTLTGVSTFTGSTRVYGDLTLDSANALTGSSNVSLKQSGATLTVAAGITSNISELTGVAGSSVVLSSGSQLGVNETANAVFNGVISGSGEFTLFGSHELVLTGVNTLTGTTYVESGATLALASGASIVSSVADINGTLDVGAGTAPVTIAGLEDDGSVIIGANTLQIETTGSPSPFVFDGDISGTGNLQIGTGAGSTFDNSVTETLESASSYTGSTIIYGALVLDNGDGDTISSSSNVSLKASGATLTIEDGGTIALPDGDSYGGEVIHELTGVAGSTVALNDGYYVEVMEDAAAATFAGAITGNGGLVVEPGASNTYALTLTGTSTYTGDTVVDTGATLAIGANGSIGDSDAVYLSGTLDLSAAAATVTISNLNDENYTSQLDSYNDEYSTGTGTGHVILGGNTLEVNATYDDNTFAGVISGSGGLTVTNTEGGEGVLELSGANTYTGVTTITNNTGDGEAVLVVEGTLQTSGITLSGSDLGLDGYDNTSAVLDLEHSGTFATTVSGSGGLWVGYFANDTDFNDVAAPTVTITGTDTYTGGTYIGEGATLAIGAGGSIADSAYVYVDSNGMATGTFDISGAGANVSIEGLSGYGDVTLGANTLIITGPSGEDYNVFGGSISGTGGLEIDTNGTLVLFDSQTYTGSTVVSGTLELYGYESDVSLASSNVSLKSGGELLVGYGDDAINELTGQTNTVLSISEADLTVTETTAASFAGVIEGSAGEFILAGTASLELLGANTFTGTYVVDEGATLVVGAGGSIADGFATVDGTLDLSAAGSTMGVHDLMGTGSVILGATALTDTVGTDTESTADVFSGVISGTGSLTVAGTTTAAVSTHLTLSGANTFSGALNIAGGTVELAAAGAEGTSGTVHFADGSTGVGVLQIDNAALTGVGTGTESFSATITGVSAVNGATAGDIIDLTGLTYEGTATTSYNTSTDILTVTEGNATLQLHVTGVTAGDMFEAYGDSHGGTYLVLEAATTTQASYEASHYHP